MCATSTPDYDGCARWPTRRRKIRHGGRHRAQAGALSARGGQKIGRNDPCPCGSGKKYKQCHAARGLIAGPGRPRSSQAVNKNIGALACRQPVAVNCRLRPLERLSPVSGVSLGVTAAGIRKADRTDLLLHRRWRKLHARSRSVHPEPLLRRAGAGLPDEHLALDRRHPRARCQHRQRQRRDRRARTMARRASQLRSLAPARLLGMARAGAAVLHRRDHGDRCRSDRIVAGLPGLRSPALAAQATGCAPRAAIMTTDTVPKAVSRGSRSADRRSPSPASLRARA